MEYFITPKSDKLESNGFRQMTLEQTPLQIVCQVLYDMIPSSRKCLHASWKCLYASWKCLHASGLHNFICHLPFIMEWQVIKSWRREQTGGLIIRKFERKGRDTEGFNSLREEIKCPPWSHFWPIYLRPLLALAHVKQKLELNYDLCREGKQN